MRELSLKRLGRSSRDIFDGVGTLPPVTNSDDKMLGGHQPQTKHESIIRTRTNDGDQHSTDTNLR